MPAFIVFTQSDDGVSWLQVGQPIDAPSADAAINAARTTAGTFVAVLARGFRPRTHYAPPRAVKPKETSF